DCGQPVVCADRPPVVRKSAEVLAGTPSRWRRFIYASENVLVELNRNICQEGHWFSAASHLLLSFLVFALPFGFTRIAKEMGIMNSSRIMLAGLTVAFCLGTTPIGA